MTDLAKITRLAEIKTIIKTLDDEAKIIQRELIAEEAGKALKTIHGTLRLHTRTNYECTDKQEVFEELGEAEYIAASSITLAGIKKISGAFKAELCEESGLFRVKSVSQYYVLTQ